MRAVLPLLLSCAFVASACRERGPQITLPPLPALRDAAVDASVLPDGALPCDRDDDCDDAIACSRDVCAPGGFCVNAGDASRCTDGVFCNGQEICDPTFGCRSGSPRRCADEDACTLDSCDEANKRCNHAPRDFDDDGEVDWHCAGGTDCDDFDATRAGTLSEICSDGQDNDCDSRIDERGCSRAEHDRCEDALDVGAGGRFQLALSGAAPDYLLGCSTLGPRDVAFTFTTDKPYDVTLEAIGLLGDGLEETASIALRSNCLDIQTEIECNHGFPGQVRIRALPPGRYFAIANSENSAQIVLDARFDDATEPPANTTCDAPLDISAGGRFEGDFIDVGDETQLACGFPDATDLMYTFTTEQEHDVELSATSLSGDVRLSFAVRTTCDDAESTLRCLSNAPARARLHQLPPGTYYVVLEGSTASEVDFSLDVAFLDPTPPPPGDSCDDPLELAIGTAVTGTLANRQDLVDVATCDCIFDTPEECSRYQPDAVYRVEIEEPTDLKVDLGSETAVVAYEFRSLCESPSARLACAAGAVIGARVRNLQPGTYFLVVESAEPAAFELEITMLPRTMPIPVGGNDTCATAIEVPSAGGLFSGDTLGFINHYEALCGSGAQSSDVAFRLVLPERSHVTASIEAAYDTVLHRHSDTGQGAAVCNERSADCDDDGGQGNKNSALDETLDAGTYYYIVDGFGSDNQGRYLFDVTVAPP